MSRQSVAEVICYLALVTSFGWTVRWSVVKPSAGVEGKRCAYRSLNPLSCTPALNSANFALFSTYFPFPYCPLLSLSLWHNLLAQHSFSSSEYNLDITVHSSCHPVLRYKHNPSLPQDSIIQCEAYTTTASRDHNYLQCTWIITKNSYNRCVRLYVGKTGNKAYGRSNCSPLHVCSSVSCGNEVCEGARS